ncbi:DUF3592 domain-containing protein [Nocardiopsis ansamitocini]|uniref:DUF3592 domain-containing protein n=1 Tax=Nocardiopsis ansamitocini TaxID=1670832 RepID=UPI0025536104|nr:DUF3592 domain-containing protein [Nocardiopsis ansamitocini]
MDADNGVEKPARSRRGIGSLVAGLLVAVLGGLLMWVGSAESSDHTGRAPARVVLVEQDQPTDDATVYVSYSAEGSEHSEVELNGSVSAELPPGARTTVAYSPDDPGHPVALTDAEQGWSRASWAGGLLLGCTALVLLARATRLRRPPGCQGPPDHSSIF